MKRNFYNIIGVVLIIGIGISIAIYKSDKLNENYEISRGIISALDIGIRGNPAVFAHYDFKVNDANFKGKSAIINTNSTKDFKFLDSLLKNKSLPVVYQKNNLDNNKMIFSIRDCRKYKVQLSPQENRLIGILDSLTQHEK